jgi:transcriptional regulator with XRE-family HTH domain
MNPSPTALDDPLSDAALAARIGAAITALRQQANLSMRELARRAGISQPFLSQIERGASTPSVITTYRLAGALGVRPGDLLPGPEPSRVTLVRATEGERLPVAPRPDAAINRAILMRPDLEISEYVVTPGQYLQEWFDSPGQLAVYLVSGQLDVEVETIGTWRLGQRDLIAHESGLRHRWLLVDDEPAHVLLVSLPSSTS